MQLWIQILRWFEVSQALLLICVIVGVISFYLLMPQVTQRRLLRWHVVMISISYLGAILFMLIELLGRMGDPLTWRAWSATCVFSIGLSAMIVLVTHLTLHRRRGPP